MKKPREARIRQMLERFNTFNSTPDFGTTRVLFTPPELQARAYVKEEMTAAGLTVEEDSIGNIFGTMEGQCPDLPPVWTGSHIDTVLHAGMFDGMAGVAGGLEAIRTIRESGIKTRRSIKLVVYTSEEPTRFGVCCLGSRAMAGLLTLEGTKGLKDKEGQSLYEVLDGLGYDLKRFSEIQKSRGEIHAAVELHIEQNKKLEENRLPIGVVTTICAPSNYEVTVEGCQSHAGGTSMEDRRDAYMAACQIALELEAMAKNTTSVYTTATVGRIEVTPGATNVIPGKVCFTVDIRDTDGRHKKQMMEDLKVRIRQIEKARGVRVTVKTESEDTPEACSPQIIERIHQACETLKLPYMDMVSGAYHDSLMVGHFAPVGMIFVPSKDGISHSPEEWTDYEDIAAGVEVLARVLVELGERC